MATDTSSNEREEDNNSSDDESEKENYSDESKLENSKATVIKKRKAGVIKKPKVSVIKKRKIHQEEDDTEETLQLLLRRNKKGDQENPPPGRIRVRIPDLVDLSDYSKCIYKQLTESDVSVAQNRLILGKQEVKDNFLSRLKESEIPGVEGVDVLVYGPDGESHEMKFKIRSKNTPVLTNGWIKFVQAYGFRKYSDFLTIWMFKASHEDGKICFAITSNRYDITKQISKRILNKVFKY